MNKTIFFGARRKTSAAVMVARLGLAARTIKGIFLAAEKGASVVAMHAWMQVANAV